MDAGQFGANCAQQGSMEVSCARYKIWWNPSESDLGSTVALLRCST